ncbi:MAG: hypothetical protein NTW45_04965 [Rhodocyclales bacterium]|nr:hypothetical protein [Rhodocyclales bacterium]
MIDAGMNDHIAKPFGGNQMFATLPQWIESNVSQDAKRSDGTVSGGSAAVATALQEHNGSK